MSGPPRDVRELVGDDVPDDELSRLARVHELLLQAGPPPELPPALADAPPAPEARLFALPERRRRSLLGVAAAALLAAFFVGYAIGNLRGGGFEAAATAPPMVGIGPARQARAQIELGSARADGNWGLRLRVRGLPPLAPGAYYTLYLSRGDRPLAPCGTFRVGSDGVATVEMNVGYDRGSFSGWVVTRELPWARRPGDVVMVTRA